MERAEEMYRTYFDSLDEALDIPPSFRPPDWDALPKNVHKAWRAVADMPPRDEPTYWPMLTRARQAELLKRFVCSIGPDSKPSGDICEGCELWIDAACALEVDEEDGSNYGARVGHDGDAKN